MQVQTSLHPSGQLMTRVTEVIPGPEGDIIPVVIVCQAEEGDGMCSNIFKKFLFSFNN